MATPDLTIYGAGVIGLTLAWEALRQGLSVAVIEREKIGAGASGGIIGALSPHVPENWNEKKAFQLESLLMAETFWAEIASVGGRDPGYARAGRLQPLEDDAAIARARIRGENAEGLWQGQAQWRVVKSGQFAHEPPSPTGYLVHDTLSGRIHPRQALEALSAAIIAKGGTITFDPNAPNAPSAAQQGTTIWATGVAGLEALRNANGRVSGTGIKGQGARFACALPNDTPQLFSDSLHLVPHADGSIALGSTTEREWDDPRATDDSLEALIKQGRAVFPLLREAVVIERWAGLRPRARSRAPMLGAWPDMQGHFIANGGFKIGFGMAPLMARALIAEITNTDKTTTIPASFRPETCL